MNQNNNSERIHSFDGLRVASISYFLKKDIAMV